MKRLVVVSNRLPPHPVSRSQAQRATPVGGLASALKGALKRAPGSLWLGWSGTVAPSSGAERLVRYTLEGVHLAGLHLTSREVSGYYRGFANEALWPLCHGFQGRVQLSLDEEATYRRVNARFARALRPLLADGDLIWVHDYHLILLGSELRRLGWTGRIGFFLHIPFPP
ncbi:MAG TPA: trehalose-6-phosphate synthase, partial [Candidatus Polarisedimenticolia bacterium]|nr:trehalose-6-phosphate synthase [Candidatus Polarisedimenticolia bacterium]